MKAQVHGIIHTMPVPFKLPNANGCRNSGLTCPLEAGTKYTYAASIKIENFYPRVSHPQRERERERERLGYIGCRWECAYKRREHVESGKSS